MPGTGDALWVEAEPLDRGRADAGRRPSWPASTAPCSRTSCSAAGHGRIAAQLREITEPSRLADVAGYSPDLSLAQKVEVLETARRRGAAAPRPRLGPRHPGRPDLARADQDRRRRGHGEDAARVPPAPPARGDPQGAGPARATTTTTTPTTTGPRSTSATCPSTCARRSSARSTSSSAPATRAPRPGGSAPGSTPSSRSPGASSPTTASTSPRRTRILDADHDGLDDVKDRILEHLAVRKLQAERGLAPVGRSRFRGHPGPGRSPRRRQDVARRVRGPRLGRKFVRVVAGRRARRGRDPRPPPHLRRGPARAAWCAPCARPGP